MLAPGTCLAQQSRKTCGTRSLPTTITQWSTSSGISPTEAKQRRPATSW
ncbi:Uncharacterised protein [Bordetella pertussis]|nr:Uncharacterised protein [Bordetella pertussis]CFW11969.1 Uncharacterised protein [Bordetella pertussis]CFW44859.1 Uncharacterised protein [Bordetella pertussis]